MALVSDIVRRAYRQENITALGQAPSTAQMAEGVELLNGLWKLLLGNKLGEKLLDWPTPPNPTISEARNFPLLPRDVSLPDSAWQYPQQNTRMLVTLGGPNTVYLKQNPDDGARMGLQNLGPSFATNPLTINANGMLIEGLPQVVLDTATTTPLLWFFRADLGSWQRLGALTLTDESPLPEEFDSFLRCALAIELCPLYTKMPQQVTLKTYKEGMAAAVGRYAQTMPSAVDPGNLQSMPYQSFALPGWGTQW